MSSEPVLVNTRAGWRLDLPAGAAPKQRPPAITSVRVRALMAAGMDTIAIACELKTTEATIWNALARAGA